jgi:peptidoglycan-N-acetylglucosamine deacetylase
LKLPSVSAAISTADWDSKVTREMIIERASKAGPGDIVLMHTWPDKTVEALPEIIANLRAKGLRFVTVSELLALGR